MDSNILIYAALQPDRRIVVAQSLLAQDGTISVQVLNEFANVALRKLRRPWPEVMRALADIRAVCPRPLPLTVATRGTAVALASRHDFAFYDTLIVASALEAGCTTLLSEDMQNGRVIEGRSTIRNHFLQA